MSLFCLNVFETFVGWFKAKKKLSSDTKVDESSLHIEAHLPSELKVISNQGGNEARMSLNLNG